MVGRHGPGNPRGNEVPMRRQGQEQGLAALEVHPLESLRIAGLKRNGCETDLLTEERDFE